MSEKQVYGQKEKTTLITRPTTVIAFNKISQTKRDSNIDIICL